MASRRMSFKSTVLGSVGCCSMITRPPGSDLVPLISSAPLEMPCTLTRASRVASSPEARGTVCARRSRCCSVAQAHACSSRHPRCGSLTSLSSRGTISLAGAILAPGNIPAPIAGVKLIHFLWELELGMLDSVLPPSYHRYGATSNFHCARLHLYATQMICTHVRY